jgi:hypothetical protein
MDIQIGDKVCVIQGEPPVCRDPLKTGEIVTVVETVPAACGGVGLTVYREGETTTRFHFAHSSGVVVLGKSRAIADMSVAEMIERHFEIERAIPAMCGNIPELDALSDETDAIFSALPNAPSHGDEDFDAKLRIAAHCAPNEDGTYPYRKGGGSGIGHNHFLEGCRFGPKGDARWCSCRGPGDHRAYCGVLRFPMLTPLGVGHWKPKHTMALAD